MAEPMPEQIASWPAPNYDNPQQLATTMLGLEIGLTVLAACVLIARFYTRLFVKHAHGIDDWIMGAAFVGIRVCLVRL
jgi:hypothetical protein